ncbi:MAG: c-type cytochrome [Gammaproteobacteria bacterium]|nr:c-type cytochrome [Gammaproteobacteria bacterium]
MQKLFNMSMIIGGLIATSFVGVASAGGGDKPYIVKCSEGVCMVDASTYEGERRFEGTCGLCHGAQGVGGIRGPALTTENGRLQGMDEIVFETVVTNGLKGDFGIMPAFGKDPNIKPYIGDIWAYLQAVKDGKITGALEEMGQKKKKYGGWE